MSNILRPVELVNTQTIPVEGAERIFIQYVSERITIRPTDGGDIILREYFNDDDPDIFAHITRDADGLHIENGDRFILPSFLRGYIEVDLPKAYYGALFAKCISGAIELPGRFVLSELKISTTSGRILLGSVMAGTASLSTVSGAIEADDLQALSHAHSTSGHIRIASAAGDGEFKTTSGAVEINYRDVTGDISAISTSGRVRLSVPDTLSFTLEAKSVSGRVDAPFPGAMFAGDRSKISGTFGAAPKVHIVARTVSGRVEITPSA